jgi:hypothetical protein
VTSTLRPDARAGTAVAVPVLGRATEQLAGCRVLVLNWRDVRHSQAGGAELYAHEISKRWVQAGVHVTWLTARDAGQSAHDEIDGARPGRPGGARRRRREPGSARRTDRGDGVLRLRGGADPA